MEDEKIKVSLTKGFVILSSVICAAVIIAAAVFGFSVPKGEGAVERGLETLHKKDREFLTAVSEAKSEAAENEKLTAGLDEKQSELDKFRTSQDNLNKITESNAALEEEKAALQSEIKEKQTTLDNLEASLSSRTNRILTWTSGDYTVGKDIAAGKYMITGTGSIAIANSGRSIANKLLKSGGESFTLNSGDRIHIDGSAKITPQ